MKTKITIIAVLLVIPLLLVSSLVMASTFTECKGMILVLKGETEAVEIGGQNSEKTLDGLLSKLDGALIKLDQAKFYDAIQKLTDYRDKILVLATQGKMAQANADNLVAEANNSIACIANIGL